MKIVTGCDAAYAPGAKALLNSIRKNADDSRFEYWCIVYGDRRLADELQAHGFNVILNPSYPAGLVLPCAGWWKEDQMPPMYARILLPKLFPSDSRVMWLDADIIVVLPIGEAVDMDLGGHPAAGPCRQEPHNSGGLWLICNNWDPPLPNDDRIAHAAGELIIDVPRWNELGVTEMCFEAMATDIYPGHRPKTVVEAYLNHVLYGNWHSLDWTWDQNPKRADPPAGTKIHHWGCVMPWTEEGQQGMAAKPSVFRVQAEKHWEPYRA